MANKKSEFSIIAGTFFRIMFEHDGNRVTQGAASPFGRYHHDDEPALYVSSRPDWAWKAVESYVRAGDPARNVWQLEISAAQVVDIRDKKICGQLGILPSDADKLWQSQIASGQRPSTWNVSDRVRQAGADGLVYTARSVPSRWHLVLFRWNGHGGPTVSISGERPVYPDYKL